MDQKNSKKDKDLAHNSKPTTDAEENIRELSEEDLEEVSGGTEAAPSLFKYTVKGKHIAKGELNL